MKSFVVPHPHVSALRALNYAPEIERIRRAGSTSARPLRDLVKEFGPGWRKAFVRLPCNRGHGVDFLSQGDIFASEPRGQVIRLGSMTNPDRYRIEPSQILLAGTGTLGENELYGRAIWADARLAGKYLTEDAMALVLEDPIHDQSLFAYAWLASPTGTQVLRSTSYGTKLLRLRKDLLGSIPIPEASPKLVHQVANLIRDCVSQRERYHTLMAQVRNAAEALFTDDELIASSAPRARASVLWTGPLPTLRAWNFASTGTLMTTARKRWATSLRDWLEPGGLFMGARVARVPCRAPYGAEMLSQRDISLIRPVPRRIRKTEPSLEVSAEWLLMASRGQMSEGALFGMVERAAHMPANAHVSGDVMRLVPRSGLGAPLYAFLATNAGRRLLQSTAYGTSIPAMREDLLLDLPMPPPEGRWMSAAASLVDAATSARKTAAAAEAEAMRILEEEVLPQWLA